MSHSALSGVQFSQQMTSDQYPGTPPEDQAHEIIASHPKHGEVGHLSVRATDLGDRPAGNIDDVHVHEDFRRQGIATELWNHANELADKGVIPRPLHSTQRTYEGDRWARAVGGKVPWSDERGW